MYAIVDIAGQQFKVEKDQKLYVHRLEGEEGKNVSFDKVLLIDTGSKVTVGDPVVKGAAVNAKIVTHLKGDKVLVFKKKRRKGYKKLNGHRQYLTQIQIEGISESQAATVGSDASAKEQRGKSDSGVAATSKAAAKPKTAAATKGTVKKEATPKAAVAKKPAATKTAAAKKPAAKKTAAAKKPAVKKPAAKKAAPKKESGEDKK